MASQQQTDRQAEILMDRSLVKEYITEKITSLVKKTYTFEEFNDIAAIRRAKALLLGPRTSKCSLCCSGTQVYHTCCKPPHDLATAAGWENSGRMNFSEECHVVEEKRLFLYGNITTMEWIEKAKQAQHFKSRSATRRSQSND